MTDPPWGMCLREAFISFASECALVSIAVVKSSSLVCTTRCSNERAGANAMAWTTMSIGTWILAKNAFTSSSLSMSQRS